VPEVIIKRNLPPVTSNKPSWMSGRADHWNRDVNRFLEKLWKYHNWGRSPISEGELDRGARGGFPLNRKFSNVKRA
jgi:hypothetical protein